ncbi:contractile injection system protein, VgrG/Pvc8 family [Gammaproteobacteria bacterium AS21]
MGLVQILTPACEITGGEKTAKTIQDNLISCTVVDASGVKSDSITITLNADGLDRWPETGQEIGCKMGYLENEKLGDLGKFKLNRISESLYPNIMTLSGTAASFQEKDTTGLKQSRWQTWEATTIGNVVRTIAKRHGYSPRVNPVLGELFVLHLDQTGETDLKFLTRLASYYDAVCKPVGKLLVFTEKGQIKSISGIKLTPVVITHPVDNNPNNPAYVKGNISSTDKSKHAGFKASWYDAQSASQQTVSNGTGPQQKLGKVYDSQQAAEYAIAARASMMNRQGEKLTLDCPGNELLAAEALLTLEHFPIGRIGGQWSIDQVRHQYDGKYRCGVEATRPK